MSYSAYAVANAFVQRALDGKLPNLSPMKLQKLMYFAQAWHIKVMPDHQPFLDDNFSRWTHGPVIPSIYHEFKAFGYNKITRPATTLSMNGGNYSANIPTIPESDQNSWGLIDAIIQRYGNLSATTLSEMTHAPNSAWAADGHNDDGSVITAAEILNDQSI